MTGPTRRQIMQMADEVGITDYNAAARLVRLALAAFRPAPVPVPVSERPWNREGWCDAEGRCWLLTLEDGYPQWRLHSIKGVQLRNAMIMVTVDTIPMSFDSFWASHCLPFYALPLPAGEEEE